MIQFCLMCQYLAKCQFLYKLEEPKFCLLSTNRKENKQRRSFLIFCCNNKRHLSVYLRRLDAQPNDKRLNDTQHNNDNATKHTQHSITAPCIHGVVIYFKTLMHNVIMDNVIMLNVAASFI
jgi:hypothetical protein